MTSEVTQADRQRAQLICQVLEIPRVSVDLWDKLTASLAAHRIAHRGGEVVGVTADMPGSNGGFSIAVFEASKVPVGTTLYAAPPTDEAARLRELGTFLLERLADHETNMTSDEDGREWHGHVAPAIARFRQALGDNQ